MDVECPGVRNFFSFSGMGNRTPSEEKMQIPVGVPGGKWLQYSELNHALRSVDQLLNLLKNVLFGDWVACV